MSGGAEVSLGLTLDEQERITADVAEMQQGVDEWIAWLRSPEGVAWTTQQIQEATAIAEKIKRECTAGKYALSPSEFEQLRRDGILRKCHTPKRGGGGPDE